MTEMLNKEFSRKTFLRGGGALVVSLSVAGVGFAGKAQVASAAGPARTFPFPLDRVDSFLAVHTDNTVTLYQSYPEMGQGSGTGFLQIAAEELGIEFNQIRGAQIDSSTTPASGSLAASTGIKQNGARIRAAAAAAYQTLLGMASTQLGVPVASLTVAKGVVSGGGKSISYGQLIGDKLFNVTMPATASSLQPGVGIAKAPTQYKLVTTRVPRIDIPDKVSGKFTYVQNVRVPNMLHGRLVRPRGQRAYLNGPPKPLVIDESSIKNIPNVQVVRKGDFVGVVAPFEYDAVRAAAQLKVTWREPTVLLPSNGNLSSALRKSANQSTAITWRGDLDVGFSQAAKIVSGSYSAAFNQHGAMGPQCVIADVRSTNATIICPAQSMSGRQTSIAQLLGMPAANVRVLYFEGGSSYGGGNDTDGPLAAATLSQAAGKPVRLQFMRWDEAGWDAYSPAHTIDMRGGIDANGKIVAYDFWDFHQGHGGNDPTRRSLNPDAALANYGLFNIPALPAGGMYVIPHRRVNDSWSTAGFLQATTMRAPTEHALSFASEQMIDELAYVAKMDPVAFRRHNMNDAMWLAVLDAVVGASKWTPRLAASKLSDDNIVTGRGIALVTHVSGGGARAANIDASTLQNTTGAVAAEIEVNKSTGKITVQHLYAAMSSGLAVNPALVENQMSGQLGMATSRALHEEVKFNTKSVTSLDWATYPLLRFKDAPKVTNIVVQRLDLPTYGAAEEIMGGPPAAIANAFFDATGVRIRKLPMTPSIVRATLTATKTT